VKRASAREKNRQGRREVRVKKEKRAREREKKRRVKRE
jgi:hypothetical protein